MTIAYALCGSFCTIERSLDLLEGLKCDRLIPIMSECAYSTDTKFGKAESIRERLEKQGEIIHTVASAEPLGTTLRPDILVISPCTGNTLAKLANGITDSSVTMAAKAVLRTDRPVLIALSSNDSLSANLTNLGRLLCRKNIFFVPMCADDPVNKPHSLIADFERIPDAISAALSGKQLRPLFV